MESWWLARDKDGFFMLFGDKPIREDDHWVEKWLNDDLVRLGYSLKGFDKMTFDDEPIQVCIDVNKFVE